MFLPAFLDAHEVRYRRHFIAYNIQKMPATHYRLSSHSQCSSPLVESGSWCITHEILMRWMHFAFHIYHSYFHFHGTTARIAFKQRQTATLKWSTQSTSYFFAILDWLLKKNLFFFTATARFYLQSSLTPYCSLRIQIQNDCSHKFLHTDFLTLE